MHQDVGENVFDKVMTYFPIARVIDGGPCCRLPVGLELPVDGAHIVDRFNWSSSPLFFEGCLHAPSLLDLSKPNVIWKMLFASDILRQEIVPIDLIHHHAVWVVKGSSLLNEFRLLAPIFRQRNFFVVLKAWLWLDARFALKSRPWMSSIVFTII